MRIDNGGLSARVWLQSLPNWAFPYDHIGERRFVAPAGVLADGRHAALEMRQITGPRAYYGAMAVAFEPRDISELVVQLPISNDAGPVIETPL